MSITEYLVLWILNDVFMLVVEVHVLNEKDVIQFHVRI